MFAGLFRLFRRRPVAGFLVSLAIHLLLLAGLLGLGGVTRTYVVKRGEPLFIELPNIDEQAAKGAPAGPAPSTPTPAAKSAPAVRPAPRPEPARRAPAVARPAQSPRPSVPEKPAPEPPAVARTEPPAPEPAPEATKLSQTAPEAPRPPKESPSAPAGESKVAMAPPPREAAPDIRSALRRGTGWGAGGSGDARGGIEGEPIPLDSKDPKFSDYLDRIRRMIKEKWGYPCVKNPDTLDCEYKAGQLVLEFGIAKDGRVPFLTLRKSSGYPIMDDFAINAVKLASPFPPVPDSLGRKGIPILATFNYVVDTSLVNLLR